MSAAGNNLPEPSGMHGPSAGQGAQSSGMAGGYRPGLFGTPSYSAPAYQAPSNQWSFGEAIVGFLKARTFAEVTSFLLLAAGVATPLVYLTWIKPGEVQVQQQHENGLMQQFEKLHDENKEIHRETREAFNGGLLQLQQQQQRTEESNREMMRLLLSRDREKDNDQK